MLQQKLIDELRKAPDSILSFEEANSEVGLNVPPIQTDPPITFGLPPTFRVPRLSNPQLHARSHLSTDPPRPLHHGQALYSRGPTHHITRQIPTYA